MKKRDKILLFSVILIALIITALTILAKFQLEQFNEAYLEEEKQEISALAKQASWAVRAILEKQDYSELKEYCSLFNTSDTRITVWNPEGEIIGDSSNIVLDYVPKSYNAEETFIGKQVVYHSLPMKINNSTYILTLSTATRDINKILTESKMYILLSVIIGLFIILLLSWYIYGIYKAFNRLQNSAVKISAGNLDTNIFIPKGGILFELSVALDKMSKRLNLKLTAFSILRI